MAQQNLNEEGKQEKKRKSWIPHKRILHTLADTGINKLNFP